MKYGFQPFFCVYKCQLQYFVLVVVEFKRQGELYSLYKHQEIKDVFCYIFELLTEMPIKYVEHL